MKQKILLMLALWLASAWGAQAQSNALHFDGTDYVACPAMNPTSFTVGAWVYPTTLGKDQAIASTLSKSAMTGMELYIGADNIPVLTIRSGSNWVDAKGTTAVAQNTWIHVAATCSGSLIYLYINGKQDKIISLTYGYTPGTQPLCIGRRTDGSALYFSGKIDEVSIWNQTISMSKISALYERGITGSETGLMAYYKFDQGTADHNNSGITSLTDATANANNGTLNDFTLSGGSSNWESGYTAPVHSTTAVIPPALGDGTSANPYQIATIENLYWLSQNSSVWTGKYFKQTADIDLAAISNWMPIGSGFVPFTGTYDGGGYTIRNLTINSNLYGRALFGRCTGSTELKNLNFENANISNTSDCSAILVAFLEGLINNCHTKGGSISGKSDIGSLCGYLNNGTITNCSSSTSLNGRGSIGGIVGGFSAGKIEFCHNTAAISGNSNALGGIVGYIGSGTATNSYCTITNCYNTANITTSGSSSGGIIGFCSSGTISKCYSTGTATGTSRVGGLVGYCNYEVINNVSYSYCLQSPVIGEYTANSINIFTGVSTKTTTQLQTQSTFSGWDFVNETTNGTADYWALTTGFNNGYPTLGNLTATCTNGVVDLSQQPSGNVYSWYKVYSTKLTEGVDYIVDGGKTKFLKLPGTKVYCTITNATFPTWIARTNAVTVDKVAEPNITFVSGNSDNLLFGIQSFGSQKIYIDWGNNTLVGYDVSDYSSLLPYSTSEYTAGNTVKMYGTGILALDLDSKQLSVLDVKNSTALTKLFCAYNNLSTLDVSKNTNLMRLSCAGNNLSTLDVSKNTALNELSCQNNSFSFTSLPQPKGIYSFYTYAPQANLPATCTGGIVDLSSQLTAKDGSDQTQTTVYKWYNANGTELVKGTDYDGKDGKFYFMKQPVSTVYCKMYNAAFPALSGDNAFRTTDITVNAVLTPTISFASEFYTGNFSMGITTTVNTTIYIDKGDGERVAYSVTTEGTLINIAEYTAGNTVKIFSDIIKGFSVPQSIFTSLDVSKASALQELFCMNHPLNFQTLPQPKTSYTNYMYAPLAQFTASCTDGIVDLSSQLTAKDANDQTQTTVYTWFNADGTELVKGVDYEGKDGQFYFMKQPASTVYCTMYNAAFPDLSGDNAFRTTDISVDKVLVPNITFVSDETMCNLTIGVSAPGSVSIDAGDGSLQVFDIATTKEITINTLTPGVPARIFGDNMTMFTCLGYGLTSIDVSNTPELQDLNCSDNKLTSLDVSKNTALQRLYCRNNNFNLTTLPQVKAAYYTYSYDPQNYFPATCTNGVVDLSSQLTAKDENGVIETTAYTWYLADDTKLVANTDYIEENGVFTFIKMPATAVYCSMYNAAFPGFALHTVNITVDAVVEPSITFVSEVTGYLYFYTSLKTAGKIYVDWGNGTILPFDNPTDDIRISTTEYTKGNTVKIFGANITKLDFYTMILSALDVSKSETLQYLQCTYNKLSTLDVSKNTALQYLFCNNNNFSFASLPQRQPTYNTYNYSSQADLAVACTNGVVDLSSQLTAVDVDGNTQTTAYSWFLADDTKLTAGTDYIEEAGVFRFVKMPAQDVYCSMTNAAFPGLTLRTVDMTVDAVTEPNISLVSENNGDLNIFLNVSETSTVYVDWGNGVLESMELVKGNNYREFSTSVYVANNTVKIYGKSIDQIGALPQGLTSLNVSNASKLIQLLCSDNKLTSLDLSKNTLLVSLNVSDNRFSFATLPQSKTSYTVGYWYHPQANLPATCTNGVVDLSSQLTATDIDGNLQTTSYTCFRTDNGLPLVEGVDYMVNQGKIYFLTVPTSDVYCEMTNPAFPDLNLRTADFTVDKPATLPEPTFTFASEKDGNLSFSIGCFDNTPHPVYIDWGDGNIVSGQFFNELTTRSTSGYGAGHTVKVYADGISKMDISARGITSLDVSKCTTLTELDCSQNSLMALNVASNTELTRLECYINNLSSLNVDNNHKLQYLSCHTNASLSELNLSNNMALSYLSASECNLSNIAVSHNTALTELYLGENQIESLDVRQNTALTILYCQNNKLTTLDVSQNTLLTTLSVGENLMNFTSLPKPQASFMSNFSCYPQSKYSVTCTNGVVDLSSQLTAVDVDGNTQTTTYDWYNANGTILFNNYMPENGVFRFVLEPGTVVYCKMNNTAFPSFALETETITIDAKATLPEPTISFVSENSDYLNLNINVSETSTVYIDWGNGILNSNTYYKGNPDYNLQTSDYVAGSTVKIYGGNISSLNISSQGIENLDVSKASELTLLYCESNKLTSLDVSKNTKLKALSCGYNQISVLNLSQNTQLIELWVNNNILTSLGLSHNTALEQLYCNNNSISNLDLSVHTALHTLNVSSNKFNIASLPAWKSNYNQYNYVSQDSLATTCTGGVVDLSSQLTAKDKDGASHSTVYTWYKKDGSSLIKGIDYVEFNGVFRFLQKPATRVYCTMNNGAYPELTLSTNNILIDDVVKPTISFVSETGGELPIGIESSENGKIYIDAGNGELLATDVTANSTANLTVNILKYETVKIFGNKLTSLYVNGLGLTDLDLSQCNTLITLKCTTNELTSLDTKPLTALTILDCRENKLDFVSLPQPLTSYTTYVYSPQANFHATCVNGVVDLGSQHKAIDKNGSTKFTVYTWYKLGSPDIMLVKGTDYTEENGVFCFIQKPVEDVYCLMTNEAFPDFTLSTYPFSIDATVNLPIVWTGTTSNDWHTASNWSSNTVPSTEDVVIPVGLSRYPTISAGEANCSSLTLKSDATGTATLIALKGLGGNVNVEQYITGHTNLTSGNPNGRFWYLSSPVSDAKSDVFNAAAANNKLWPYSEAVHNYVEITDNTTALEVGRGYCVRQGSTGSVAFKGTLNSGSTTINVSYANDGHVKQGFNLVGNPYTAYIDWNNSSLIKTNLVNSYWLRGFNGTAMVFDTYISGVGTNLSGIPIDGKIAPMQAFWVKADGQTGSLSIPLDALTHSGQKLVKGGTVDERPILRLKVSNGTQADEAIVLFDPKATNSFDNQYDAPKLSNDDAAIPEIFTLSGTREIVINSLKDVATNKEVALGFRTGKAGKFTIKASEIKNFSQAVSLILEDKLTGTKQNLSQTPEYAFSSEVATVNNRFVLHFAESTTGIDEVGESTKVNIWLGADNQLNVELGKDQGKSRIQIYTPLGQQLLAKEFAGTQTQLTLNYQPGVYLVSVITGNQKTTRKIVIQ
jgi:hypothetical protein